MSARFIHRASTQKNLSRKRFRTFGKMDLRLIVILNVSVDANRLVIWGEPQIHKSTRYGHCSSTSRALVHIVAHFSTRFEAARLSESPGSEMYILGRRRLLSRRQSSKVVLIDKQANVKGLQALKDHETRA
jgi:hypothetical protein